MPVTELIVYMRTLKVKAKPDAQAAHRTAQSQLAGTTLPALSPPRRPLCHAFACLP